MSGLTLAVIAAVILTAIVTYISFTNDDEGED